MCQSYEFYSDENRQSFCRIIDNDNARWIVLWFYDLYNSGGNGFVLNNIFFSKRLMKQGLLLRKLLIPFWKVLVDLFEFPSHLILEMNTFLPCSLFWAGWRVWFCDSEITLFFTLYWLYWPLNSFPNIFQMTISWSVKLLKMQLSS